MGKSLVLSPSPRNTLDDHEREGPGTAIKGDIEEECRQRRNSDRGGQRISIRAKEVPCDGEAGTADERRWATVQELDALVDGRGAPERGDAQVSNHRNSDERN